MVSPLIRIVRAAAAGASAAVSTCAQLISRIGDAMALLPYPQIAMITILAPSMDVPIAIADQNLGSAWRSIKQNYEMARYGGSARRVVVAGAFAARP